MGSVGNGSTLRLISDIEGVKYTEGRFLPYFFPDTFHEGGDPVKEAKENWVTARRAILRKPIDRIGYGGYLKLALQFPEFVDYVESVCKEFRELYENIKGTTPYCVKRVAVLNCWGKMRAWGCHMVHHALYYKQNYSYSGPKKQFAALSPLYAFTQWIRKAKSPLNICPGYHTLPTAPMGAAHNSHKQCSVICFFRNCMSHYYFASISGQNL